MDGRPRDVNSSIRGGYGNPRAREVDNMTDELNRALWERVKKGIETEGWTCISVGSGRAMPMGVKEWLRSDDVGFRDPAKAIVVVIEVR